MLFRSEGYEIHAGTTAPGGVPLLELDGGQPEGAVSGEIAGTYLHGVLERREPRQALLAALAARRGVRWEPAAGASCDVFDRLADVLEANVRLHGLVDESHFATRVSCQA